jgi:outer membrane protein assembly factor BamB
MLVALDGATGQEVWRFAPGNLDIIPGSPALDTARSIAVFASYAGVAESQPSLWAIDTTSGQKIWSLALGHISTSPGMTLDGSMVYVADDEGVLYKVETATGQVVWTHVFGGEPYGAPWVHYTGSMLFLSDQDGKVWSILDQGSSAASNPAWGSGSGYAEVAGPSQVVLSDIAGKMYVGASDGKIWELSESTGAGSYIFIGGALGDPVVHRQASRLMFGSASGRIHCLTIPFVRCDELRVFGMETGTGLLYPDGPFDAYAYYGLRARAVWRGLGPGAHVQTIRWWTPSGQLYQQFSAGFSATGDGYPQEVSVDIPLAGTGAQRMPGQWMVEVFLDDTTTAQGTRYFILE